ncbi:MAG: putative zinc-binding protein [Desulfuromonadaceae bacterium]
MRNPPLKIMIVPCSGIGKPYGTISRVTAYQVTEDDRPELTRLVPLALLVMGDEESVRIVAENPTITIDGCTQACATKNVHQSGGRVVRNFAVLEAFRRHRDLKPQGIAELNEDGEKLAVALAQEIVAEVDALATSGDGGKHA